MNALVYARKQAANLRKQSKEAAKKLEALERDENTRLSKIFLARASAWEEKGNKEKAEHSLKAAAYWEKQGQ